MLSDIWTIGEMKIHASLTQAYERRMRRFNLKVIFAAVVALTIVIAQLFIAWRAFPK
jgi:hypothetical protein